MRERPGGQKHDRLLVPDPNTGCLLWMGTGTLSGYGQIRRGGRRLLVHRWIWETYHGPVPPGMELDHKCRVRCCGNLAHLELVTHRENVLRGTSPIAARVKSDVCLRCGSRYAIRCGYRICLECKKQYNHERYHRLKETINARRRTVSADRREAQGRP